MKIESIKNNLFCLAVSIAIVFVVIGLICLAPPITAYLMAAGMIVGVLSNHIRFFFEISDTLY